MILIFFLAVTVASICTGFLGIFTLDYRHRAKRSNLPRQALITAQEVWLIGILLGGLAFSVRLLVYAIAQITQL